MFSFAKRSCAAYESGLASRCERFLLQLGAQLCSGAQLPLGNFPKQIGLRIERFSTCVTVRPLDWSKTITLILFLSSFLCTKGFFQPQHLRRWSGCEGSVWMHASHLWLKYDWLMLDIFQITEESPLRRSASVGTASLPVNPLGSLPLGLPLGPRH